MEKDEFLIKVCMVISIFVILFFSFFIYSEIKQNHNEPSYNDSKAIEKKVENVVRYEMKIIDLKEKEYLIDGNSKESQAFFDSKTKEKYFIYFGRNDCPYCQIFLPELSKVLKANDKMKVYYFDTNVQGDTKEKMIEKYHLNGVPTLIKIENNKLENFNSEKVDISSFLD